MVRGFSANGVRSTVLLSCRSGRWSRSGARPGVAMSTCCVGVARPLSGSVDAVAAGEDAAVVAEDAVVAGAAGDPVVAPAADEVVVAGVAEDHVVAAAGVDGVVAATRRGSRRRPRRRPSAPTSQRSVSGNRSAGVGSARRVVEQRDRARQQPHRVAGVGVVGVRQVRGAEHAPLRAHQPQDVAVVADDRVGVGAVAGRLRRCGRLRARRRRRAGR